MKKQLLELSFVLVRVCLPVPVQAGNSDLFLIPTKTKTKPLSYLETSVSFNLKSGMIPSPSMAPNRIKT